VDVNAGIHGSWTLENAKSMLHQFIQMRHIRTDYKYAMQGNSFVAEMSFYVKVRYVVLDRGLWIRIDLMLISVADPGCLSRILIFTHPGSRISDLGSRIQKQQQKRGVKKNLLS
jgi:hypothetical protein